jgi:hypothetical protein
MNCWLFFHDFKIIETQEYKVDILLSNIPPRECMVQDDLKSRLDLYDPNKFGCKDSP